MSIRARPAGRGGRRPALAQLGQVFDLEVVGDPGVDGVHDLGARRILGRFEAAERSRTTKAEITAGRMAASVTWGCTRG
jgi:hypothetical protein